MKYIGINLTKEVKYLYEDNHHNVKRRLTRISGIERCTLLLDRQNQYCQSSYISKAFIHTQCIPNKIPTAYFIAIEKTLLKSIWNQKTQKSKVFLGSKTKAGGIVILDFKLCYKATIIKMSQYWNKNRHMDQWNITEDMETFTDTLNHLIFDKRTKVCIGRKTAFSTSGGRKTGFQKTSFQKMKLNP